MTGEAEKVADELERLRDRLSPLPWAYDSAYQMFVGQRHAVVRRCGDPLITGIAGPTSWNDSGETQESRTARNQAAADAQAIVLLMNNLPLILSHLRAGSDAAVERAAAQVYETLPFSEPGERFERGSDSMKRYCRDTARAAIRAAVSP